MTPKPRRKLGTLPKKRLSGRREAVTIAIGFRFDEGALFCADSKHVGGVNIYEPKVFTKEHNAELKSVFAFSGVTNTAKMAVQRCQKALDILQAADWQSVEDRLDRVLTNIQKKYIWPDPMHNYSGGPDFILLFGIWTKTDGLKTCIFSGNGFSEFDTYYPVGTGADLARYILAPRYRKNPSLDDVFLLASLTLEQIKRNDPNCGGASQCAILKTDGTLTEKQEFDISQAEEFSLEFHEASSQLYLQLAPLNDFRLAKEPILQFADKALSLGEKQEKARKERERRLSTFWRLQQMASEK